LKKFKPIIIVAGEPNSIFIEIFFKALKKKIKSPIILVASYKLLKLQMKKLKYKKKILTLDYKKLQNYNLDNRSINLININYNVTRAFDKISVKSNKYIEKSFKIGLDIIKTGISNKFINGPVSKKSFLKKKYLGITEYISEKFLSNNTAMLIYNDNLAVSPITTHLPLKFVNKKINKKNIKNKVKLIVNFYKTFLKLNPRIAILGLNPHCESIDSFNEDEKIIKPVVKELKMIGYKVSGPLSADTIFLRENRKKFDVIVGMYHDQVLTPIKTIYEYDAINITLGLPFIRISPDHGPNERMLGKNKSNPLSLIKAISFLDKH
tara:strand:- start:259 stop:1224 length:966 start_codon:yes stop_codon:yes gene_type:complete